MFTVNELKMIYHVFGNAVGGSEIAHQIYEKASDLLDREDVVCAVTDDLRIRGGFIELNDSDINF